MASFEIDLFGEDSDSDSDVSTAESTGPYLRTLVDEHGRRKAIHPASRGVALASQPCPPKYIGPIVLEALGASVGGGRGFVAAAALPPGTLLLSEVPLLLWSDMGIEDGRGGDGLVPFEVRVLRGALSKANAREIVTAMGPLYPETLDDYADQSVVHSLRSDEMHATLLRDLPSEHIALAQDEALRLVLALRSNSFASGVSSSANKLSECASNDSSRIRDEHSPSVNLRLF